MDCAFITTWKVPFPGRERQALAFAQEAFEYWEKQAADGRCTAPEWFFTPGSGMWMVKGERTELERLANEPAARHLQTQGLLLMQDWSCAFADTAEGAQRFIADYAATANSL